MIDRAKSRLWEMTDTYRQKEVAGRALGRCHGRWFSLQCLEHVARAALLPTASGPDMGNAFAHTAAMFGKGTGTAVSLVKLYRHNTGICGGVLQNLGCYGSSCA